MRPCPNRRSFLPTTATGLGGVALAHLLGRGLVVGAEPVRPAIYPANSNAPRAPHFEAKAKRG